jgi:aminopeptidase N
VSVYHRSVYRCNRRAQENMHDRTRIERCQNSEIGTHILEGKVFEMIREIMLDPGKLRGCINNGGGLDDRRTARALAKVARKISTLDQDRRQLINRYAADLMTGEQYISGNRALDEKLERLVREKAKLAAALQSPQHEDFVDANVWQFCASANARLQASADFDAKQQFLVDHVERVIYNRYNVTIVGSAPVQSASGETKLQFRIEGKIDIAAIRSAASRKAALEAMRTMAPAAGAESQEQPLSPVIPDYSEINV